MSHVFPGGSRRSELDIPPRCGHKPHSQLSGHSSSGVPNHLSMASPKRSRSLPPRFRHSQLWLGNHSPPPSNSQSNRDFSPLQSLELPRNTDINCDVHEAFQVFETSGSKSQLLESLQLPSDLRGHSPLSRDFSCLSKHSDRVHARCSDVLLPLPDLGPILKVPTDHLTLRKSDRSSRIGLHRSVSLPTDLSIFRDRLNSPLCPRRTPRRFIQSANPRSRLAENTFHPLIPAQPLGNQAGLLGPCPLSSHSKRSAPKPSKPKPKLRSGHLSGNSSSKESIPTPQEKRLSNHPHPKCPLRTLSRSGKCRCPGILQNPGLPRASSGNFSPATTAPSPGSSSSLQRPVHLHKSGSHSQNLRPSRFRSHPKQQTRVQLGHTQRLGQSTNLRSHERPNPSQSVLRVFPQSLPKVETPLSPTLAKIPYPFFPCAFNFGSFSSSSEPQVSHSYSHSLLGLPQTIQGPISSGPSSPLQQESSPRTSPRVGPKSRLLPSKECSILGPHPSISANPSLAATSSPKSPAQSKNNSPTPLINSNIPLCRPSDLRPTSSPTDPRRLPHQSPPRPIRPFLVSGPLPGQLFNSISSLSPPIGNLKPTTSSSKAVLHTSDSSDYNSASSGGSRTRHRRKFSLFSKAFNNLSSSMLKHPFYYSSDSSNE
ncbi:putative movement protein [tomato blistering mosaic tymovirus]|uniref:Putative movement protein n=1 Tax=tomato blistering mosaic tymovirus TaxID=2035014 RepID=S5IKN9_9VIRU|nr:putative movement protein [Tomato blistering mosaic virus]AGQ80923.1 putative movement protein [Tomato blistering mosaic virus]